MRTNGAYFAGAVAGALMLWGGAVLAQNAPAPANPTPDKERAANCQNKTQAQNGVKSPETIQGQVTNVDPEQGKLTMRSSDGTVRVFQAPKEVLQQYKVGDQIKATLRPSANC